MVYIALTRYASLASILSLSALVILMVIFKQPQTYILFSAIILGLALYRHRGNIVRLKEGRENKIFSKNNAQNNKK